jgi:3-phytase
VGSWRVSGASAPTGAKLGGFTLGTITEGCVIDDEHGQLYAAEELKGIWRVALGDTSGAERTLIDEIVKRGAPTSGAGLVADVEGLALWNGPDGFGYLIASVQGQSRYAVYDRRAPNAYRGSFTIGASADGKADTVSGTDGIEVLSAPLGPDFPRGLFVAQDDENTAPPATQNFKYVSWAEIETALKLQPQ